VRTLKSLFLAISTMVLVAPVSASAETRESYLERLTTICSVRCLPPKDLLRAVRKQESQAKLDVAVIMDVRSVSLWNGKYLLHSDAPADGFNNALGIGALPTRRPISRPDTIVVEMDEDIFFDFLNLDDQAGEDVKQAIASKESEIIVEGERDRDFEEPSFTALREALRNRRIVVRGKRRLEVALVGARRDFRRKKLFIELDDADDLAMLPRYNEQGEPIFDGPLEGLRAAYSGSGK